METPLRSKNRLLGKTLLSGEKTSPDFVAPETPLLKRIGYGTGIGVYQLERTSLTGRSPKSPWAIKKALRQHKNNAFYDQLICGEASLLRQLNHPNIIGFRGLSKTDDGRDILAMEECSTSLGNLIEQRSEQNGKMFRGHEILNVCLNTAKALDYLHNEVMIMHGDIKSYNILVNGDFETVKLCDFGVSIKVDKDGKALDEYIGTELWAAPEVINEDEVVTTKADIFSLGLVIYEMIALQPPHVEYNECSSEPLEDCKDDEEHTVLEESYCGNDGTGTRPNLPDVSFGNEYDLVLQIYNSCTEQDPNERPSCKDLIRKIEEGQKE